MGQDGSYYAFIRGKGIYRFSMLEANFVMNYTKLLILTLPTWLLITMANYGLVLIKVCFARFKNTYFIQTKQHQG